MEQQHSPVASRPWNKACDPNLHCSFALVITKLESPSRHSITGKRWGFQECSRTHGPGTPWNSGMQQLWVHHGLPWGLGILISCSETPWAYWDIPQAYHTFGWWRRQDRWWDFSVLGMAIRRLPSDDRRARLLSIWHSTAVVSSTYCPQSHR